MAETGSIQELLGLEKPPIAVGFFDAPPEGIEPWTGTAVPAGCAFWKEAQQGKTFYTVPGDHYNCAVGAYTHKISLPADREGELMQTVGFMVQSDYLRMEEVPGIPTLSETPGAVAYGPVEQNAFKPDAVIVAATPAQAMLLYESALAAGAGAALTSALGRPGCAVLPLTQAAGATTLSFGCKGNRTFTGLPEAQMYVCVPGDKWPAVVAHMAAVTKANQTMAAYYESKLATDTSS